MPDAFESHQVGLTSPANGGVAVTPSDSADLTDTTRALYVGGDGNVSVIMRGGQTVTFTGMKAGVIYPLRVNRVRATGTTATGIVALY
jgi:hypothetical protein